MGILRYATQSKGPLETTAKTLVGVTGFVAGYCVSQHFIDDFAVGHNGLEFFLREYQLSSQVVGATLSGLLAGKTAGFFGRAADYMFGNADLPERRERSIPLDADHKI